MWIEEEKLEGNEYKGGSVKCRGCVEEFWQIPLRHKRWWEGKSRKGWQGAEGVGWGGLLKHWLASSTPRWWRRGSGRISALWPPQVAQYIMLEAILLEEKAAKWRTPVDRLLNVLEVVVWGGLKPEPQPESLLCPTVWLHRATSVGRRGWGSPSCVLRSYVCQCILLSIPRGALGKPVDKTKCQMLDIVSFSFSLWLF